MISNSLHLFHWLPLVVHHGRWLVMGNIEGMQMGGEERWYSSEVPVTLIGVRWKSPNYAIDLH